MGEVSSSRYIVQAGWDSVPHLDDKTKQELLDSTPEYLRDARSKGEPTMGSGVIYPIPISDIEVKPFAIPFGWKKGLRARRRLEPHRRAVGRAEPGRRHDLPLLGTLQGPATAGRACHRDQDARRVDQGLHRSGGEGLEPEGRQAAEGRIRSRSGSILIDANNELEAGLIAVWQALALGQMKIFSTLQSFKAEYRVYQRDERGKIKEVRPTT